jgi:hypothetical protein
LAAVVLLAAIASAKETPSAAVTEPKDAKDLKSSDDLKAEATFFPFFGKSFGYGW